MNQKQILEEGNNCVLKIISRNKILNALYRKLSTAIVTRGTLRKGCVLVCGQSWAKVRGLFDHNGEPIDSATPGTPAEILGWRELPFAGDEILEVESEVKSHIVFFYKQFLKRILFFRKKLILLSTLDSSRHILKKLNKTWR